MVSEQWVYGPGLSDSGLRLDGPGWFAWLEALTTSSFSYPLFDRQCGYIIGFMTVRKERRQRGGSYWTVYRRQGHQLRKIYLGPSSRLTQARLEAVAATLLTARQQREGGKDTRPRQEI
ncbi:MAG: hypothetical protein HGB28_02160 [Oscillochloris sp.]|nr:hypothetical protein [Oscillochloris sp.]